MSKKRLDKSLVERDVSRSRSQAKELIKKGEVLVNGIPVKKPASLVDADDELSLLNPEKADWVGRGGRKIWPFLESGWLSVEGAVCVDVGSSTGGFTQALIRAGARSVHAVDVGEGQLAFELRQDDRVTVMEDYNFRYADSADFSGSPSFFTMDVSFISTTLLVEPLNEVTRNNSSGFVLIKPQFEADRDENEEGVVKDESVVIRVLQDVLDDWRHGGWYCDALAPSPIEGPSGNLEYVARLHRNETTVLTDTEIESVVRDNDSRVYSR
ncbi:MAG: TlyA family RNA methyltransferase [bacterium]